jgi:hypothetical protein
MRGLNRYAQQRGIRLLYGGYGVEYGIAQNMGEYRGEVFLNRGRYPDGLVYQYLAFLSKQSGIDSPALKSCRGNESLNGVKSKNLPHFVDAVEPSAIYVHHEDRCVFEKFHKAWLGRRARPQRRWPNDSLLDAPGGVAPLAHGYSALIGVVNRVKCQDSGYDASRDTEIIIVSPATPRSDNWGQVLELWRQIVRQPPKVANVRIGFRETLPQPGGEAWVTLFNRMMSCDGLPFGAFTFVGGGTEEFPTDCALSGIPAINAHFLGSRSIHNAIRDIFREPMEIIAAQYAGNVRGVGFYCNPARQYNPKGIEHWIHHRQELRERFGRGRLFDEACALQYGREAGVKMSAYYQDVVWLHESKADSPGIECLYYAVRPSHYLHRTGNYRTPEHWNHLLLDAMTVSVGPSERHPAWAKSLNLFPAGPHQQLARRWQLAAEANTRDAGRITTALEASLRLCSVEDLRYPQSLFTVTAPLLAVVRNFHAARAEPHDRRNAERLQAARRNGLEAARLAEQFFPDPVDLGNTEVHTVPSYDHKLAKPRDEWVNR